jgi:hypothetical protein
VYRCNKGNGKGCKEYDAEERAARRAQAGYDVQFDPKTMKTVASVPYEANVLAMFINSATSYHGVRLHCDPPRKLDAERER